MSRSLGDYVIHTAGVISTPEIFHYTLQPGYDQMLIVGTDGLWDSLTNEEVVSLASNHSFWPSESVLILLQVSYDRWIHSTNHGIDDTTIGIVKFACPSLTSAYQQEIGLGLVPENEEEEADGVLNTCDETILTTTTTLSSITTQ